MRASSVSAGLCGGQWATAVPTANRYSLRPEHDVRVAQGVRSVTLRHFHFFRRFADGACKRAAQRSIRDGRKTEKTSKRWGTSDTAFEVANWPARAGCDARSGLI